MKTGRNRNDVRMHVLILVVLKTGSVGAQLPGIPPLFPLQEPSTFAFDLQPLQSAYHGFASVKTNRGFGAVAQFVSISTHATCKALLAYSLPLDQDWVIALGLGLGVHSWSNGTAFSMDFPMFFQVNRGMADGSKLAAFVRGTNQGQLLGVQERGEFDGGLQWTKRHRQGAFSAFFLWGHPASRLHIQWMWALTKGKSMRLRVQPLPLSFGLDAGWERGKRRQWIGITHSNFLGLWLWSWRMDFRK